MRGNQARPLEGMAQIADYVGKSYPTVLKFIKNENFPAKKLGGEWTSYTDLVDEWKRRRVEGTHFEFEWDKRKRRLNQNR